METGTPNARPDRPSEREKRERSGGAALGFFSRISPGAGAWGGHAGLIGAALAGSVLAAGMGLLYLSGSSPSLTDSERSLTAFPRRAAGAGGADADGDAAGLGRRVVSAASSLEYVVKAPGGAAGEGEPAEGGKVPEGAAAKTPSGAGKPGPAAVPASAKEAAKAGLAPSRSVSASAGPGAYPRLDPQGGLSGGIGADFQPLARGSNSPAAARALLHEAASAGSPERRPLVPVGRGAARQLVSTDSAVRGNLRSGRPSSPGSGVTYDGSGSPPIAGGDGSADGGTGAQIGATGAAEGPNPNLETLLRKHTPPVPHPGAGRNATPYQGLVYAAIGSLALGGVLLLSAGFLKKRADAALASNPVHAAALLAWVRRLAFLATAASAAAVALGLVLVVRYGQVLQGAMFSLIGGILTYQSANVLLDSSASEKAQRQIAGDSQRLAGSSPLSRPGAP